MSQRLETLRGLLQQDPSNSRIHYMLAMELVNTGDLESAVAEFEALSAKDAGYSAAYYHGGQSLEKLRKPAEARAMYQRGIEATTRNGDEHTRGELQAALDSMPD